jgi:predicted aspartyl protease
MGITRFNVEIANVAFSSKKRTLKFIIDSGAIYSLVPSPILEQLQIQPIAEQIFTLADGSVIKRRKGGAVFRYRKSIGVADVIFGEPGDQSLLGAVTLESLGLALDPVKGDLHPIPLILGTMLP